MAQHHIKFSGNTAGRKPANYFFNPDYKRLTIKLYLVGALTLFIAALLFPIFAHARGCGYPLPSRFDVMVMSLKTKWNHTTRTASTDQNGSC